MKKVTLVRPAHRSIRGSTLLHVLVLLLTLNATGRVWSRPKPIVTVLPTAGPTGSEVDDNIPVIFFPAEHVPLGTARAPAIVLLHSLGADSLKPWIKMGRRIADQGIGVAVMTLPYHMARLPAGEKPGARFISMDSDVSLHAFQQASSDVSTVVAWLRTLPGVEANRIGVAGVSLGAIVAHLAMGQDESLSAGVAILGGGDLAYIRRHSILYTLFRRRPPELDESQRQRLSAGDPLTYAARNQPRRVLMVAAARDTVVPPHSAEELWKALGKPPIRWVDTDHLGLALAMPAVLRASVGFLKDAWIPNTDVPRAPRLYVPTVTIGFISGLDETLTPAIQIQPLSLGRWRNHTTILHLTAGLGGRGFFGGAAVTINPYIDAGIGRRWHGSAWKPYLAFHLAL